VLDLNDLDSIYESLNCEYFDCERFGNDSDVLVVDDTGILVNTERQEYFKFRHQVDGCTKEMILAGIVMIAGVDQDGKFTEPSINIEAIRSECVEWLDHNIGAAFARQFQ